MLNSKKLLTKVLSRLQKKSSSKVTITIGSITADAYPQSYNGIVILRFAIGTGNAFSSFTSNILVGTVPSGFRPATDTYGTVFARTEGSWSTSTYYPVQIMVNTDGEIHLRGNETNIKSCKYITGEMLWFL